MGYVPSASVIKIYSPLAWLIPVFNEAPYPWFSIWVTILILSIVFNICSVLSVEPSLTIIISWFGKYFLNH